MIGWPSPLAYIVAFVVGVGLATVVQLAVRAWWDRRFVTSRNPPGTRRPPMSTTEPEDTPEPEGEPEPEPEADED